MHSTETEVAPIGQRPKCVLAEFEGPRQLLAACEGVRTAGYREFDAHTPFPVHGLDAAMGLGHSPLGWAVFLLGMAGAAAGMLLQWWVSVRAYPLNVAGKPLFSWPAFVPVAFELGVLGGAVAAVAGFLALARLPRLHHPLFQSSRFERASDDGFFLSIDADGSGADVDQKVALLVELGATQVEVLVA